MGMITTWKHQADVFKFSPCFVEKSPISDYDLGICSSFEEIIWFPSLDVLGVFCVYEKAPQNEKSPWQFPFNFANWKNVFIMVDVSLRYLQHKFFLSTICIFKNLEKDENGKQKVNILTNWILRHQSMIKVP